MAVHRSGAKKRQHVLRQRSANKPKRNLAMIKKIRKTSRKTMAKQRLPRTPDVF